MTPPSFHFICASKPGCSRPVLEVYIDGGTLWIVLFLDETTGKPTIEILPDPDNRTVRFVDLAEAERMLAEAKRQLLSMPTPDRAPEAP